MVPISFSYTTPRRRVKGVASRLASGGGACAPAAWMTIRVALAVGR
jgi:hypothetical protein